VDNLALLKEKLTFVEWFYEQSMSPFEKIKDDIDHQREPYVPPYSEDYDEPPFLTEWLDASDGLKFQQQLCLSLLQRSMREYLDAAVANYAKFSQPKRNGNWFENYKKWFMDTLQIDWQNSPVPLQRIEELTLARDCVQHGGGKGRTPEEVDDTYRLLKKQSLNYQKRFPDAFYVDQSESEMWKGMNYPQPVTIQMSKEAMHQAIAEILDFCGFVEEKLPFNW